MISARAFHSIYPGMARPIREGVGVPIADMAWDDDESVEQSMEWDDEDGNPQQMQWDQ